MYQTLITVLRYSITYYQKDLFICTHYANKHKATALHKAYWLPCCICRHAECLQMYAVSVPFELILNFPQTFSKLKPAYDRAPHP